MASPAVVTPERAIGAGLRHWARHSLRPLAKRAYGFVAPGLPAALRTRWKHSRELGFWQRQLAQPQDSTQVDLYYRGLLLAVAGMADEDFLADKIVADFGCGPRGTLNWIGGARQRIGIDVLADEYGPLGIRDHAMCYVCSSESAIPLPSGYVDVLFTINALDHVTNLTVMCRELLRILRPGGMLIASINLGEPPSLCEPQRLTESKVQRRLLDHLHVENFRCAPQGPAENVYAHFFDGSAQTSIASGPRSGPRYLWLRARKPEVVERETRV